jgi:hypothetical protein
MTRNCEGCRGVPAASVRKTPSGRLATILSPGEAFMV